MGVSIKSNNYDFFNKFNERSDPRLQKSKSIYKTYKNVKQTNFLDVIGRKNSLAKEQKQTASRIIKNQFNQRNSKPLLQERTRNFMT